MERTLLDEIHNMFHPNSYISCQPDPMLYICVEYGTLFEIIICGILPVNERENYKTLACIYLLFSGNIYVCRHESWLVFFRYGYGASILVHSSSACAMHAPRPHLHGTNFHVSPPSWRRAVPASWRQRARPGLCRHAARRTCRCLLQRTASVDTGAR